MSANKGQSLPAARSEESSLARLESVMMDDIRELGNLVNGK